MLSLRAEIVLCLFAVALLGLLAGWMMQRARAERRLHDADAAWADKYASLERSARQDEDHLEEQLQSLGDELRILTTENRALRESSRSGELSLETARAEAIELNRRQAETQERLQRIIRERDHELAALRAGGSAAEAATSAATSVDAPPADGEEEAPSEEAPSEEVLSEEVPVEEVLSEALPAEETLSEMTLADDPLADADIEAFDETIRIESLARIAITDVPDARESTIETTLESTLEETLDGPLDGALDGAFIDDLDEATIALDEATLAQVRAHRGRD